MSRVLIALALLGVVSGISPAAAQLDTTATPPDLNRKVFIMGGRMAETDMGQTLFPFTASYEDTIVLGAGYQEFFAEPFEHFRLGVELGAAARIGSETTTEIWGGVVGRYEGFVIDNALRVTPSLTFGASLVSDTMGTEAEREAHDGLPGDLLFYFSPEISLSTLEHPESEVFWRLHHRSGAWNSFGGGGSANATMIGIRTSF